MSSYVDSVIGSGEEVKYEAKVSIWSLSPLFVIGLLTIWIYGLGLIFWAIAIMRYMSTELVITNKKIISKFGLIKRDTIEMLLPKIESIQVNQSVLGRILNYGSVVVSGAGNPQAPVPGISSPIEFRKRFMAIQENTANIT